MDGQTIELLAPAKINLCLHVLGRRPDGYHELYSLICCVALYDRLLLTLGGSADEIVCDPPWVPADSSNLALKAAVLFNDTLAGETDRTVQRVAIQLSKCIPVGAGLGGGSSDAAAVLNGLNRHYGRPLDRHHLHALALRLGADVPFFIDQRPAIAQGIGERLTPYEGLPPLWAVLVYPGFALSTVQVYQSLNLALTKSKKKIRYFRFKKGNFSVTHHLHNDLEAGVGDHLPVIEKIKDELSNQGAIGSLMTGSGSVVYGLFADEAGARRAKAAVDLDPTPGRRTFVAGLLA
ncbi:MAG: 4-(cytidine 5'-diphospho)-2-C-methyl-D-erythritol kinase [Desulfatitalea sp.]